MHVFFLPLFSFSCVGSRNIGSLWSLDNESSIANRIDFSYPVANASSGARDYNFRDWWSYFEARGFRKEKSRLCGRDSLGGAPLTPKQSMHLSESQIQARRGEDEMAGRSLDDKSDMPHSKQGKFP